MYHGLRDELMAFFVGGPANGMTLFLPIESTRYDYVSQSAINKLDTMKKETDIRTTLLGFKRSIYKKTHRLQNPYLEGCWIYEWMGDES